MYIIINHNHTHTHTCTQNTYKYKLYTNINPQKDIIANIQKYIHLREKRDLWCFFLIHSLFTIFILLDLYKKKC